MDDAAYRDTPASCPVCRAPMELRNAGESVVDVCPTCRGLWIDWLDGDTRAVTELAMPLSIRADPPITRAPDCPRCKEALAQQTSSPGGLSLWRCGGCAGTFLPRSMVDTILALEPEYEDEAPTGESSLVARLVEALRAVFAAEREPLTPAR